jgi:hypothetical protein
MIFFLHVVHDTKDWYLLHPQKPPPPPPPPQKKKKKKKKKSTREHGEAKNFHNIGGSTTRESYRPIKGITCHLQGIEPGQGGVDHQI